MVGGCPMGPPFWSAHPISLFYVRCHFPHPLVSMRNVCVCVCAILTLKIIPISTQSYSVLFTTSTEVRSIFVVRFFFIYNGCVFLFCFVFVIQAIVDGFRLSPDDNFDPVLGAALRIGDVLVSVNGIGVKGNFDLVSTAVHRYVRDGASNGGGGGGG